MPHACEGVGTLDDGSEVNYGASGFCVHEDFRPSPTTGKGNSGARCSPVWHHRPSSSLPPCAGPADQKPCRLIRLISEEVAASVVNRQTQRHIETEICRQRGDGCYTVIYHPYMHRGLRPNGISDYSAIIIVYDECTQTNSRANKAPRRTLYLSLLQQHHLPILPECYSLFIAYLYAIDYRIRPWLNPVLYSQAEVRPASKAVFLVRWSYAIGNSSI